VSQNPLGLVFKNTLYDLIETLPQASAAPLSEADILEVCRAYRSIGSALLLMGGDPRPFYACLFRSSRAFVHLCEQTPYAERVLSRALPLFDAIACRDHEGARRIAQLAPEELNERREYEERFLYMRIIIERFFLDGSSARIERHLRRYEELTQELPDEHLHLCRALVHRDQSALGEALDQLIEIETAAIAKRLEQDRLGPDEAPLAGISVEVLAWLELAERAGLSVEEEYRLAPGIARLFHRARFGHPDGWRDVGSLDAELS
jgi:hypothetical protein